MTGTARNVRYSGMLSRSRQSAPNALVMGPDPGRGVFSTLLVIGGVPVELDAHLDRLRASVRKLYGTGLPAATAAAVREPASGHDVARLRVTATPRADAAVAVEIAVAPFDAALVLPGWERAIDLRAVTADGWRGAHKWADRRRLEAIDGDAAPAAGLLVDGNGAVLETTRANVFAVFSDGVLRTPPADGAVLPGIARGLVLAQAREAGLDVREEPIALADLAAAREAFLTGSLRGVEPVRSVDGAALPGPGDVTTLLVDALRRRWLSA